MILATAQVLVVLLGWFSCLEYAFSFKKHQAIVFTVPFLGLVLYIAALINFLSFTAHALIYLGYFFLALYLLKFLRKSENKLQWPDSLYIFYMIFFLIIGYLVADVYFYRWDEFSFWGSISRYIAQMHHLPIHGTAMGYKDYPPGAALFHYFIYTIMGKFSEPYAYFAQDILLFSPLICFFNREKFYEGLSFFCLAILIFALYEKSIFHILYVDYLLIAYFTAILGIYLSENNKAKALMIILPSLLFLITIKQAGFFLAAMAMVIIVADLLYLYFKKQNANRKVFFLCGLSIILLFCVHFSWKLHCQPLHITPSFSTHNVTFSQIKQELSQENDFTKKVIANFEHEILFSGLTVDRLHISVFFILIFILFWQLFLISSAQDQLRYMIFFTFLNLGIVMFEFGLLLLYLNVFSHSEAIVGASFGRYSRISTGIGLLTMLALSQHNLKSNYSYLMQRIVYQFSIALVGFLLITRPHGMHSDRQEFAPLLAQLKNELMRSGAKRFDEIFILTEGQSEQQQKNDLMLEYGLFPYVRSHCAMPDTPSAKICNENQNQFIAGLSQYQYLLTYQLSQKNLIEAGKFLRAKLENNRLYLITKQGKIMQLLALA